MRKILTLIIVCIAFVAPSITNAMNVSVHIPEKYMHVKAGERLYFEIDVKYPENKIRKDLRIFYRILDGEKLITETKVLRAIETQASFMDFVVVPSKSSIGMHTLSVVIEDYENLHKEVSVTFNISPRIDKMMLWVGGTVFGVLLLIVILLVVQIVYTRARWRKALKAKHDYTNIPTGRRIYHELIGDAIVQMRARVGRRAIVIASKIDGLTISKDGRVDEISREPSEVIAELVMLYKSEFGKDVSFALK